MTVDQVRSDRATEGFLAGTARGVFLLKQCGPAGHHSVPSMDRCEVCGSPDLTDVPASGTATLVSWAVTPAGPTGPGSPTVLVIAQLAEGPWWWSQLIGVGETNQLQVGEPLTIRFESAPGGEAVPVFTRADRSELR